MADDEVAGDLGDQLDAESVPEEYKGVDAVVLGLRDIVGTR